MLIDEVKKVRDECVEDEEFYRDVSPWLDASPLLQTNKKIIQEIRHIRRELDKIISKYEPDENVAKHEDYQGRHGKWLPDRTMHVYWICSCCGFPSEASGAFKLYKYCPNCGAKMDEEMENNHGNE